VKVFSNKIYLILTMKPMSNTNLNKPTTLNKNRALIPKLSEEGKEAGEEYHSMQYTHYVNCKEHSEVEDDEEL